MQQPPRTPRTPTRKGLKKGHNAPKIASPTAIALSTPKTPGNTRNENVNTNNTKSVKPSKRSTKISADVKSIPRLRLQTSREIAEVIALIKTVNKMKVFEVSEGKGISKDDLIDIVSHKCPIIFRGLASEWNCVREWSKPNYLHRAAEEEAKHMPHRKYRQFTAHSSESGRLHLTDGKAKAKAVSMADFLENTDATSDTDGLYLLGIHAVGSHSPLSYCPVQNHVDDGECIPPLSKDIPSDFEMLKWYSEFLAREEGCNDPIPFDHQQFFLAKGYAFTDLHYDSYDNFYVAVSGTRRWTLASPEASRWLIDSASGKLKSGSAAVPHQGVFSSGSPAQIYPFTIVDLEAGDVLYVPSCWWHLVESMPGPDGFSSAFNFFFSKPPERVFGEFQSQLGRMDSIVSSLQSECRAKIASACKYGRVTPEESIPREIRNAPGSLSQELWDQLLDHLLIHGIEEDLQNLHLKHSRNAIIEWESRHLGVKEAGTHTPAEEVKSQNKRGCDMSSNSRTGVRTPKSSK